MSIEPKISNQECAVKIGVGRSTISAVRRMLGIPSTARKVFASQLSAFLRRYPDFTIGDSESVEAMDAFRGRHPEFVIPSGGKI